MGTLRWNLGLSPSELVDRLHLVDRSSGASLLSPRAAITEVRQALGYQLPIARIRTFLGAGPQLPVLSDAQVVTTLLDGLERGRFFVRRPEVKPAPELRAPGTPQSQQPYEPEPVREPREREPEPIFEIGANADDLPILSVSAEPEGAIEVETTVGPTPDRND
jgi:hypothetical protein